MIHPSPALIVRAETSVIDCVKMMREHDVGSVLVVSDDVRYELLGIFTERDLLKRVHQLIENPSGWNKPVHALMTRKLVTIELSRMHEAAKIMLKGGFRHLPVVDRGADGKPYLTGVVSMRDIFRDWALAREGETPAPPKHAVAGRLRVFSDDPALLRLLKAQGWEIDALEWRADLEASLESKAQVMPLVIDADGLSPQDLARVLKTALGKRPRPRLLVAYNPATQPSRIHQLIEGLASVRGVLVFKRPFNLVALSQALSEFKGAAGVRARKG